MSEPPPLPPPPFWRTEYFHRWVRLRIDRAEISNTDIIGVINAPVRRVLQNNGRWKIWGRNQADTRWLSVILLADEQTVHTTHYDRNFRP